MNCGSWVCGSCSLSEMWFLSWLFARPLFLSWPLPVDPQPWLSSVYSCLWPPGFNPVCLWPRTMSPAPPVTLPSDLDQCFCLLLSCSLFVPRSASVLFPIKWPMPGTQPSLLSCPSCLQEKNSPPLLATQLTHICHNASSTWRFSQCYRFIGHTH